MKNHYKYFEANIKKNKWLVSWLSNRSGNFIWKYILFLEAVNFYKIFLKDETIW